MKVIFLDIDGVLNSVDYMNSMHYLIRSRHTKEEISEGKIISAFTRDKYGVKFDPRCVNYLEAIVNKTKAKIVISSTWRKNGIDSILGMWKDRGLPSEVIGLTGCKDDARGNQIERYLEANKNIDSYVIIDDEDFYIFDTEKLVKTNGSFGLTITDAEKAVNILNKNKK